MKKRVPSSQLPVASGKRHSQLATGDSQPPSYCGYVAILGAPNAGKSTLLNALVGQKLAIVTPKVQTTRNRVVGICAQGASQMVFLDTPGIYAPLKRFEKAMVTSAWTAINDADVLLLLVDAHRGMNEDTQMILKGLHTVKKPVWLALNKVDLVDKPQLLAFSKLLHEGHDFAKSFMISAQKGNGLELLKDKFAEAMPEGPWLFPEDQMTTQSERDLAAEITREKIFLKLRQELPYSVHVETEKWEEAKAPVAKGHKAEKPMLRISQLIFVQREAHKKILLGDKGQMLKSIGIAARRDMEAQFGQRIHLALFIKVREGWKEDREVYERLGLEYKR